MDINIEQLYKVLYSLSDDKEYKNNLDSIYGVAVKLIDIHKSFNSDHDEKELDESTLEDYKEKIQTHTGDLQHSIQGLLGMLPDDVRDSAKEHLESMHAETSSQSGNLLDKIEQLSRSNLVNNLQSLTDDKNVLGQIQSILGLLEGLSDSHKELKQKVEQNPQSEEHVEFFKSNVETKQQNLFETLEQLMQSLPEDVQEQAKPHVEKVRSKSDNQLSDLLKLLGM